MSDLLPAVLLNALRQYKFDGSPLWRMADGKDHVKIEVTFRKPTNQRFDKKGLKVGGGLHPLLASGLASPLQSDARQPDRRLQKADSQLRRRRRQHHQHSRHYRSTQLPSQWKDHRGQHRSRPRSATFFRGDWSWTIFYGHSLPSDDSRRTVVSFWRKNVHNTG